jgi:hypothetical protein
MTEIGCLGAANGDDLAHFDGCGDRRHRLQVLSSSQIGQLGPQAAVCFYAKLP